MSNVSPSQTNTAFGYQWRVWRFMGIRPSMSNGTWRHFCYTICLNVLVTILFPLTLTINVFMSNNLQQLCENLSITITDITANVKFVNIFCVRKKILKMEELLTQLDGRIQSLEESVILRRAIQSAQLSFKIFWCLFSGGMILSMLRVYFREQRCLLYPAWFGSSWQDNILIYHLIIIYQLLALSIQAIQNVANDSYPAAYLIILTAHVHTLRVRILKVGHSRPLWENSEHQQKDLETLNECIEDYITILRCFKMIQHILSKPCLSQFICSGLVLCTVSLHFLYVVDAADYGSQLISVIFFVANTLEVFIICYFGQQITSQCSTLTEAFSTCEWMRQTKAFHQNLIITLIRTQRDAIIYAGSYIPVNLTTFVLLMKYAYSIFTLLLRFK